MKPKRKNEKPVLRDGLFDVYGIPIIIPIFLAPFAIFIISGMTSIIVGKLAIFFSGKSDEPLIDLALIFPIIISGIVGLSMFGIMLIIRHYTRSQFNILLTLGLTLTTVAICNLLFFLIFLNLYL